MAPPATVGRRHHAHNLAGHPFLVRLGGLPVDVMQGAGSALLDDLEAREAVAAGLSQLRSAWVDQLHDAIHGADPPTRRRLLDLKRAAFNGRPLRPFQDREHWRYLSAEGLDVAGQIVDFEANLERLDEAFHRAFEAELERLRRHLLTALEAPDFARGLALASPVLVAGLDRLRRTPARRGRKERKAELSLWRYVSRAALKPSPFASLARVAPAEWLAEGAAEPLVGDLETHGSVRAQRYIVDQLWHALRRHPAIRDRLLVVVEPSAQRRDDGRWRLVRPPAWHGEPTTFRGSSVVDVRLGGALVDRLIADWSTPRPFATLREVLTTGRDAERATKVLRQVDRLVDVGFLRFEPPWSNFEPILETALAAWLKSLELPELDTLIAALDGLIEVERDVAHGRRLPAALEPALDAVWQEATQHLEAAPTMVRAKPEQFYEDVVALPADASRAALRASQVAVESALAAARTYARCLDCFDRRHEIQFAVAEILWSTWGERPVPVIDAFVAAWPTVQRMVRGEAVGERSSGDDRPRVTAWRALRNEVATLLEAVRRPTASDRHLDATTFDALAQRLPGEWPGGAWFLQPIDDSAESFVLHRSDVATGRHAARFIALFEADRRSRWCRRARALGGHLLDVPSTAYDTLNVHGVQTARVLDSPVEPTGLDDRDRLALAALAVRVVAGRPRLEDRQGQPWSPVHLGAADPRFSQPLHRFLTLLGPGTSGMVEGGASPPAPDAMLGNIGRVWLGDRLVLQRRRVVVTTDRPRELLASASASSAFRRLDRWRREVGLPVRCFWLEGLAAAGGKPQYLDFSSPIVVDLLRAGIAHGANRWVFEEALPDLDGAWPDTRGRRWVGEWLIDESLLQTGGECDA